jgi:hypothetical protein
MTAGLVLLLVFLVWYPAPYFRVAGAREVLVMVIFADLVLGPLLTLILFKPGKAGLWFDVVCISVLKVGALVYGVGLLFAERPAYAVFAKDRVTVLSHKDVSGETVRDELCTGKGLGPCLVVARVPEDPDAYQRLLFETLQGGADIERRPAFWVAFDEARDEVRAASRPLQTLGLRYPDTSEEIERVAVRTGKPVQSLRYLPALDKSLRGVTLIIDSTTAEPIAAIEFDPWEARPTERR